MCSPIITESLDPYDNYVIGNTYQCWTNDHGNIYVFDKSHTWEIISGVLIGIGGISLIGNLIYCLYKCVKYLRNIIIIFVYCTSRHI